MEREKATESADDNQTRKLLRLFVDQKPTKKQKFILRSEAFAHESNENSRVELKKILGEDNDNGLILGSSSNLPQELQILVDDDDDVDQVEKQNCYEDAVNFLNRVGKRFGHENSVYRDFLHVLTGYARSHEGNMSLSGVCEKVYEIFGGHQDLVEDFKLFLPLSEILDTKDSKDRNEVGLEANYKKGLIFFEKVKGYFCSSDKYLQFLKIFHYYSIGEIGKTDLHNMIAYLLGNSLQLLNDFHDFLDDCRKNVVENKKSNSRNKEKCKEKSIQELDFSDSENCSPSYWRLPKEYPIPCASSRTKLYSEVLNDKWVCRPSIVQGSSFKNKHRNKQEEILLTCDDDKYELDMIIEYYRSCIKSIERVLINGKINLDTPVEKEKKYFTVQNLRTIERLYDDCGLEVLKMLSEVPCGLTLPLILDRMEKKIEKLEKNRTALDQRIRTKIYAKLYHKSLDKHDDPT